MTATVLSNAALEKKKRIERWRDGEMDRWIDG